MDALALILRCVRDTISATGAPPDAIGQALDDAERRLRTSLGGGMHHISRLPQTSNKQRIAQLREQGLSTAQISARLEVDDSYVRRITRLLRSSGQA